MAGESLWRMVWGIFFGLTDPACGAIVLKVFQLQCTLLPGCFIVLDTIDNPVLV